MPSVFILPLICKTKFHTRTKQQVLFFLYILVVKFLERGGKLWPTFKIKQKVSEGQNEKSLSKAKLWFESALRLVGPRAEMLGKQGAMLHVITLRTFSVDSAPQFVCFVEGYEMQVET
jgi:hypothetical protein